MQKWTAHTVALGLAIGALWGCAPERSTEEYRNERMLEERAAIEQVRGEYTGVLVRSDGSDRGTPIGTLRLRLSPQNESAPAPDQLSVERRIALRIDLFLDAEGLPTLTFLQGALDRGRRGFQASTAIVLASGSSTQLDIIAAWDGAELQGELRSSSASRSSATFRLARLAAPAADTASAASRTLPTRSVHSLKGVMPGTPAVPFRLDVLSQLRNPEQSFAEVLRPIQTIDATLRAGGDAIVVRFTQGQWDRRRGVLSAQGGMEGRDQVMRLDCVRDEGPGAGDFETAAHALRCSYYSSLRGMVFEDLRFDVVTGD